MLEILKTPGCGCGSEKTQLFACHKLGDGCTLVRVRTKNGQTPRYCSGCPDREE